MKAYSVHIVKDFIVCADDEDEAEQKVFDTEGNHPIKEMSMEELNGVVII